MKITNKQEQEIEFMCLFGRINPTQMEKEEYIKSTVLGGDASVQQWNPEKVNPLFITKRKLDINIAMWREDLTVGLLGVDEFEEEDWGRTPYFQKMLQSMINGVTPKYRTEKLKSGGTLLAFTNFPDVMSTITDGIRTQDVHS